MTLKEQADVFGAKVESFAALKNMGRNIFEQPESLTIRPESKDIFFRMQEALAAQSEKMAVTQRGWRFLTLAKLRREHSIALAHFGEIDWVEILEPTVNQESAGQGGIVAMRFLYPEPDQLRTFLRSKSVKHIETLEGISVPIGNQGIKINFTDAEADTVVDHQIRMREAVEVRLR